VKRRYLVIPGAIVLVLAVLAVIWMVLIRTPASYDGTITMEVRSTVRIQRDASGIPHIRSDNLPDAYFAMGFVHAQDRIMSMELLRILFRGRYCEYAESDKLHMDRLLRSLNFSEKAAILLEKLDQTSREYLETYTEGINSFKKKGLNELPGTSAIPHDPWSPADVLSIMLFIDWSNSFLSNREILFPVPEEYEYDVSRYFLQNDRVFVYGREDVDAVAHLREVRDCLVDILGPLGTGCRGLGFAIPPSLAQDNVPVLSFNLDHSMDIYPAWYPLAITAGGRKLQGYTYAGLPFFYAATTGNYSYLLFSLAVDTQFFFRERIRKREDKYQYFAKGMWNDFSTRMEIFKKGKEDDESKSRVVTQYYADEFPVIYGVTDSGMLSTAVTMHSASPEASAIAALLDISHAGSAKEAVGKIRGSGLMPSVLVFQDETGTFTVFSGKVPFAKGRNRVVLDSRYSYLSNRYLDLYTEGFTSSQVVIAGSGHVESFPYQFRQAAVQQAGSRYERLGALLEEIKHGVPKEIESVLSDTGSSVAKKYLPVYMTLLEKMPVTSARLSRLYFNDWDYRMDEGSVAASIYHAVSSQLPGEIFRDEMPGFARDIQIYFPLVEDDFYRMLEEERAGFFDDTGTTRRIETRDMIFDRSFLRSLRFLNESLGPYMEKWEWGSLHQAGTRIPLMKSGFSLYGNLFNTEPTGLHGSDNTVLKSSVRYTSAMSVADTTVVSSYIWNGIIHHAMRTGVSLNPFSEYYDLLDNSVTYSQWHYTDKSSEYSNELILKPGR